MAKKKNVKYPSPSSFELLKDAALRDGVHGDKCAEALGLEYGGMKRWSEGRRWVISAAFCNGYRDLFDILPSLDRNLFISTVNQEEILPYPNPYKAETVKEIDDR